jgi:hypothetical protein
MSLDDELNELLAGLGVIMEEAPSSEAASREERGAHAEVEDVIDDDVMAGEEGSHSELCLFQTSREHYGVFYRLDLVDGAPQLRVFLPDESGPVMMRGYLVRAAATSPLRSWFVTTRAYGGSEAYDDARDTAQQHLLFAAGELMKRLFWAGEPDGMRFPDEITVRRLV